MDRGSLRANRIPCILLSVGGDKPPARVRPASVKTFSVENDCPLVQFPHDAAPSDMLQVYSALVEEIIHLNNRAGAQQKQHKSRYADGAAEVRVHDDREAGLAFF